MHWAHLPALEVSPVSQRCFAAEAVSVLTRTTKPGSSVDVQGFLEGTFFVLTP